MPESDEIEKKLDEALALLRVLRPPVRRIAVQEDKEQLLLKPMEIVYFTSEDRGLRVVTTDGKPHFNFKGLADMEKLLADDPRFMRVHKSFIVNLEHVSRVKTIEGGRELQFDVQPELRIKVSQDRVKALEAYFGL